MYVKMVIVCSISDIPCIDSAGRMTGTSSSLEKVQSQQFPQVYVPS